MFFTIITINYNNQNGLRRTIESVVGQTYRDYEYIIVDGASTDNSIEVVQEFGDKITSWVSEKDRGIYHAMNKGVAKAHGDYCIFMNSGDFFYDNTVLDIVSKCCVNEDVIVGKVVIDNQDHIISPPPITGNLTLYHLYSGSIPHQGSFIRTDLLRTHPYDENLKISSDWKFFVQTLILDNCSIRYVDVFIARYDINGYSSTHQKQMQQEKERILSEIFPPRVLSDYLHMKSSECLTQKLTPVLRQHYTIDKILYNLGRFLIKFIP